MTPALFVVLAVALFLVGWLVPPLRPRAPYWEPFAVATTVEDVPPVVRRHVHAVTAGRMPVVIGSMVVVGRARVHLARRPPVWVRARSELWPGAAFENRFRVTWFGLPVFTVVDRYVAGRGSTRVGGAVESGPKIDQAASIALWALSMLSPEIMAAPHAGEWEAMDETVARLHLVDRHGRRSHLDAHFDAESHLLAAVVADRFKRSVDELPTRWTGHFTEWREHPGPDGVPLLLPDRLHLIWADERRPWLVWRLSGVAWNVPVGVHSDPFSLIS